MATLKQYLEKKGEALQSQMKDFEKQVEIMQPMLAHCEGDVDNLLFWAWMTPPRLYISLVSNDPEETRAFVRGAMRATRARTATRKFDDDTGKIDWMIKTPTFDVQIVNASPACKVKKVEEEVAVPARKEKRVRYVLENPEECFASMKAEPDDIDAQAEKQIGSGPAQITGESSAD